MARARGPFGPVALWPLWPSPGREALMGSTLTHTHTHTQRQTHRHTPPISSSIVCRTNGTRAHTRTQRHPSQTPTNPIHRLPTPDFGRPGHRYLGVVIGCPLSFSREAMEARRREGQISRAGCVCSRGMYFTRPQLAPRAWPENPSHPPSLFRHSPAFT